jgi:hypothetical protein
MRVLVTGGRFFSDWKLMDKVMSKISITTLIEGGARGADWLAHLWAASRNIPIVTYNADWKKHKKAAGAIRNSQMLSEGKPDLVVAFPGGKGTSDMVKKAKKAGVDVLEVDPMDYR